MSAMITVALAQINATVGDISGNAHRIIDNIRQARSKGAHIVVFPELALVGYPPEDLLLKPHFIAENKRYLATIRDACDGITALVGFVDEYKGSLFNSCAVIQQKAVRDIYHKIALPNYGVFDEKRYFHPGEHLTLYRYGPYTFSVSICEDIWHPELFALASKQKIDFLINLSASPFHSGKVQMRQRVLSRAARCFKSHVFYCNLIGGQDEIVFDGTSSVLSPRGALVARAKRFCEDMLIATIGGTAKTGRTSYDSDPTHETYDALKLGLRDYVHKNGFKKAIVGVSGGVDSAVVIALAAEALGPENVCGLLMPSRYTSHGTLRDARLICSSLGVKSFEIGIETILASYARTLERIPESLSGITRENLQARVRGNLLMAFSNAFGYLVLNTGNKSEVSCGYCTLYGDMVGGFALLKDVYKTRVYDLAAYINQRARKDVIPRSVIRRAPTAELKPNQKDSDVLPVYRILDPILKLYVEDNFSPEKIIRKGYGAKTVRRVVRMVDTNEYKRRQAPLGVKITPRAFGRDRRMPVTNAFFR